MEICESRLELGLLSRHYGQLPVGPLITGIALIDASGSVGMDSGSTWPRDYRLANIC